MFLGKSSVTCYVISMVYTLIDHSSRPISARRLHCFLYSAKDNRGITVAFMTPKFPVTDAECLAAMATQHRY